MLVENIMYFALGLLIAGLLALVLMPAIWKRAVRLTKRRIEAATPISMAEFRADKDQLRAEFALHTRRLELTIENLRTRLTTQLGEVAQARTDLAQIKVEREQNAALMLETEKRETLYKERITELEKQLVLASASARKAARAETLVPTSTDTTQPEAPYSDVEGHLSALIAATDKAGVEKSLLADELSGLEASDKLRDQLAGLEARIRLNWATKGFDPESLRDELTDIASGVSRLVYAADNRAAPQPLEESLFDRIKRFADDGETEDLLPAAPVAQRGSVTDRLSALRELRGS